MYDGQNNQNQAAQPPAAYPQQQPNQVNYNYDYSAQPGQMQPGMQPSMQQPGMVAPVQPMGAQQPYSLNGQQQQPADPNQGIEKVHAFNVEMGASEVEPKKSSAGKSSNMESSVGDSSKRYDSLFRSEVTIAEDQDRLGFIRKVYAICTIMILTTCAITVSVFIIDGVHEWMMLNLWLHYTAVVVTLVLMVGILCGKACARKVPMNYILLVIFTLAESYVVAGICGLYKEAPEVVLMAACTTFALFIGLTAFACCCKGMKLTICWGVGAAVSFCMFPMIIFLFIFPSQALYNVFCVLGVILFSIYIVFDTRMIMKWLSVDEYVIGALMLYIDVIQLFLYLLSLFGNN